MPILQLVFVTVVVMFPVLFLAVVFLRSNGKEEKWLVVLSFIAFVTVLMGSHVFRNGGEVNAFKNAFIGSMIIAPGATYFFVFLFRHKAK